jgi:hypothetical protein
VQHPIAAMTQENEKANNGHWHPEDSEDGDDWQQRSQRTSSPTHVGNIDVHLILTSDMNAGVVDANGVGSLMSFSFCESVSIVHR